MGVLLLLVVCLAVAAAVAAVFGLAWAPAGALAVLIVQWGVERTHRRRLMNGLRDDALNALPARAPDVWGEIARRVIRLLRDRDERLRESQARLQEFLVALENSPNGVVLLDENGRIEWCNQTAAGHFGFDAERDKLQYIGNLVRDPVFAAYLASWNYTREVVIEMSARGGAPLKLSVQAHPYAGSRRLILSRDVTAVEQAEAMRRDFVANVSHEIRTPLTVLAGFVETMQTLPLEREERARYLQLMQQQAQRMHTLVNDLLALSKLEGSPPPGVGEWLPLQSLMAPCEQEAKSLSRVLGPNRPHDLVFVSPPALEVSGSTAELQSAISNLLSNAVRYTPVGGHVEVRWQQRLDGRAELSVKDSGPGVAPEHLSRLTERFYRVDRSRSRETGGTGLGLAIVKHVVQRHGAELKIESALGAGSTFSIVLPASRVRVALSDANARPAKESLPG